MSLDGIPSPQMKLLAEGKLIHFKEARIEKIIQQFALVRGNRI